MRPGHDQGPGHVQRRHGGQLIDPGRTAGVVARADQGAGVDDPDMGEQPGRGHRDHLDEQAGAGHEDQHVAHRGIAVPVPDEQPQQAGSEDRDVQLDVVIVEPVDQGVVVEDELLGGSFAREVEGPFQVPDVLAPGRGRAQPADRPGAGELPHGVQDQGEGELPGPGTHPAGPCPGRAVGGGPGGRGGAGQAGGVLPGHPLEHRCKLPTWPGTGQKVDVGTR